MKFIRSAALLAAGLALLGSPVTAQKEPTLFGQASAALLDRMLEREFRGGRTEYLLMNARTGEVVATTWASRAEPAAVGSLLKPFVALAYAGEHGAALPEVVCHGRADGCWRVLGHGRVGLRAALASSCNAYFLALARGTSVDAMMRIASQYGLPGPPERAVSEDLIGLTDRWKVSPMALAAAYARLGTGAKDQVSEQLLAGMKTAATSGTAARIGQHRGGVLAKTGTAPCRGPACIANGDGLVVALVPAEQPRLVLLVRQRGTTGASTAAVAGRMLDRLEQFGGPR